MTQELPQYEIAVSSLTPVLNGLPKMLIAIDGQLGAGKTTLGRYLAWKFNIALVETDLFLLTGHGNLIYWIDALKHVISSRLKLQKPVIVEGIAVRRLLRDLAMQPNYVIYLSDIEPIETNMLKDERTTYESEFAPLAAADLVIEINSAGL